MVEILAPSLLCGSSPAGAGIVIGDPQRTLSVALRICDLRSGLRRATVQVVAASAGRVSRTGLLEELRADEAERYHHGRRRKQGRDLARMLEAEPEVTSAIDIFVKDLGLVLDTARATKFPLPLASTAHQMFMQASTAGYAREDDAAVIKIFPGITVPAKR